MKIRKPTNWGTTNHSPAWPEPCASTMSTSDSEPAVMATPSSDSPIATS